MTTLTHPTLWVLATAWVAAQAPGPFTLYVVEEQGRFMVAKVVPDRLVEGRHR